MRAATRFYRTGDFVRHNAQGDLVFLGRRDRQVKVQGRRIQLDEIESTLQKHFSSAEIACTVIKQDGADPFIVAAIAGGTRLGMETRSSDWSKTNCRCSCCLSGFSRSKRCPATNAARSTMTR